MDQIRTKCSSWTVSPVSTSIISKVTGEISRVRHNKMPQNDVKLSRLLHSFESKLYQKRIFTLWINFFLASGLELRHFFLGKFFEFLWKIFFVQTLNDWFVVIDWSFIPFLSHTTCESDKLKQLFSKGLRWLWPRVLEIPMWLRNLWVSRPHLKIEDIFCVDVCLSSGSGNFGFSKKGQLKSACLMNGWIWCRRPTSDMGM